MANMNIMKYTERDVCTTKLNDYTDSKPQLRQLFGHQCCYCTIHEGENHLGFFHVDHFRPYKWFKELEKKYENLYYACHKCNVYKRDNWISTDDGCIRDCNKCHNNVCQKAETPRFIDPCSENPSMYIEENVSSFELITKDHSKVGQYTIEMMRLNRNQLIRLRRARRKLLMWLENEKSKLGYCLECLERAREQKDKLEQILKDCRIDEKSETTRLLAEALHDSLRQKVLIYEKELIEIDTDLKRVADVVYEKASPYEW